MQIKNRKCEKKDKFHWTVRGPTHWLGAADKGMMGSGPRMVTIIPLSAAPNPWVGPLTVQWNLSFFSHLPFFICIVTKYWPLNKRIALVPVLCVSPSPLLLPLTQTCANFPVVVVMI